MWLPSSVFESFFKGKEKGLLCMTFEVQTRRNWSLSMCVHAQMHPTLYPIECSLPCASVHGISQARILEWVAMSSSRGSSLSRDQTQVSCIGRWVLYHWATWEASSPITVLFKRKKKCLMWKRINTHMFCINMKKLPSIHADIFLCTVSRRSWPLSESMNL